MDESQAKCSKRYKFYGTGRDQGRPFQPYAPSPWGISRPGVSSWVSTRVKNGNLVWCNEDGNEWSDDKEINKARRSGKGVKVLSKRSHKETIKMMRESTKKKEQEPYDPDDPETHKLYEEFGDILRVDKGMINLPLNR